MTVDDALVILETGLKQGRLSRIQELVFRQAWEGQSYAEIATNCGYDVDYVKNIGSNLWQILSNVLGEKVTKSNVQSVLKRRSDRHPVFVPVTSPYTNHGLHGLSSTVNFLDAEPTATDLHHDWGEAIDTSLFYGRTAELATLGQWIIKDHCRVVALLGIGGIGKTALSVKLAQQIEPQFEYVIWRCLTTSRYASTLHHAPPVQELLVDLINFLDNNHSTGLTENTVYSLSRLIELLRKQRCLLILDNVESILHSGDWPDGNSYATCAGCYLQGYEGYGELFNQISEVSHQSCLVLTSREKPKEIAVLEGKSRPVRSLQLKGLGLEAQELLKTKGLSNSEAELKKLIEHYEGNPLALMIVSETIKELFNDNISNFFNQNLLIFGELYELLDQQFSRLSKLEKEVVYWLSLSRSPVSITDLSDKILSTRSKQALTEILCALKRRSLLETSNSNFVLFTLNPLVLKYIDSRLTKETCEEIFSFNLRLLNHHASSKAQSKDYMSKSQVRYILKPVTNSLIVK